MNRICAAWLMVALLWGCSDPPDYLPRDQLMDPETCKDCHPTHYEEWSSSMHAYAADDPVFIAMNERGQRETNGALGDFCIGCHAPMAVALGATTDGLNVRELPKHLKGVTCYFCHSVAEVAGEHNNPLVLAEDDVLRGGIDDPVDNGVHRMAYSPLHDRNRRESSTLCGSCHDIVLDNDVHLERTFKEWQDSLFSDADPRKLLTCGRCHMDGDKPGVIADFPGVPTRYPKEHSWPGVDTAFIDWPGKDLQLEGIYRDLSAALNSKLCVQPAGGGVLVEYNLDNLLGGHMLPSGSAQDRRQWAEVVAYREGEVVFESGRVADGQPVTDLADSNLWQMRDFVYGADDQPVHMFWDVVRVDSQLLPPSVTNDAADPRFNHSVTKEYSVIGEAPDRVTARVLLRSIGLDVLQDLVDSGDLDEALIAQVPTFELESTVLEWTSADGFGCVTRN